MLDLASIVAARERIRSMIYESPCAHSRMLSQRAGCELFLKLENLQMSGSFKERGACNKLALLDAEQRQRGVIAASAGNHGQGVAYHAQRLGIDATIVMPLGTPLVKVAATEGFGARVVLHGSNYDEAHAHARTLEAESGASFVHPFEDADVMAGQGTLGLELMEQSPDLDAIVVPVGGGGLAAGIAVAIKAQAPHVSVYGVEANANPSMGKALEAGHPVQVEGGNSIADGIAVRQVGAACFQHCRSHLDRVVGVDEEAIAEAVLILLEQEKTLAEGAGATALAGVLSGQLPLAGKRVAVLVSGGNIDVNLISRVIDRGLWRSGRMVRLRSTVMDKPGALAKLLAIVGEQEANVLEISHERLGDGLELGQSSLELVLETRGFAHVEALEAALGAAGVEVTRDPALPVSASRRPRLPHGR